MGVAEDDLFFHFLKGKSFVLEFLATYVYRKNLQVTFVAQQDLSLEIITLQEMIRFLNQENNDEGSDWRPDLGK